MDQMDFITTFVIFTLTLLYAKYMKKYNFFCE
jgi:hypothetical protein